MTVKLPAGTPAGTATAVGDRMIVVRYQDGRMVKGTTADFLPNKPTFHVYQGGAERSPAIELSIDQLKAVFFVKSFGGQKGRVAKYDFTQNKGYGRKCRVTFLDGEVRPIYRNLVQTCEAQQILQPKVVYGYWPCQGDGDDLIVYDPADAGVADGRIRLDRPREVARFTFPRQRVKPFWCLSDFWRPRATGEIDVIALTAVTVGQQASDVARQWLADNRYRDYLYLHGLSVESAEALAEYIHRQVRVELGIAGGDARELRKLLQQGYQGSRFSFGYPACPDLEDQAKLCVLLEPGCIGMSLSEEFQIEPEQSTNAIVAHHPEARYFNVRFNRKTDQQFAVPVGGTV